MFPQNYTCYSGIFVSLKSLFWNYKSFRKKINLSSGPDRTKPGSDQANPAGISLDTGATWVRPTSWPDAGWLNLGASGSEAGADQPSPVWPRAGRCGPVRPRTLSARGAQPTAPLVISTCGSHPPVSSPCRLGQC